jgi:hypothetical protein
MILPQVHTVLFFDPEVRTHSSSLTGPESVRGCARCVCVHVLSVVFGWWQRIYSVVYYNLIVDDLIDGSSD